MNAGTYSFEILTVDSEHNYLHIYFFRAKPSGSPVSGNNSLHSELSSRKMGILAQLLRQPHGPCVNYAVAVRARASA